ncbi:MAG: 3-deoxy-manno-octulosonate cytidylyltransferase [Gammaproteobacteria bacterium GWE2_37_16]|nr:MAG: 3-deoxy-manno-octulosonate cytidylyltransferase [Gammaproteobacteria bacterium GWE2_37_16]
MPSLQPFHVIIPARYASSRLPGKALAYINGKPMLQHVYERSLASDATSITIATDDKRIAQAAEKFNAKVCMTSTEHSCGTSRIVEAINILNFADEAIIVNVQGDEPLIPPIIIQQVAENLATRPSMQAATLCSPIESAKELFDSNIVKVVMDNSGAALYFSRAPIPWERDNFSAKSNNLVDTTLTSFHYRHIGIYAYRVGFLKKYATWSQCILEETEKLEQLRILWNGDKIHVAIAKAESPIGVDNLEDLEKIRKLISKE